jgi:UDP-N-acetylglucosamine--N-acetylmuramyl-(pentapeptide) pyrophosphoryl-undecaprenol N-acetylglucosamine transferase
VSNNEQEKNARQLGNAGGAVVFEEKNCTGELLFETVKEILLDGDRLMRMSAAQESLGNPKAAENIAELILSLAGQEVKQTD